MKYLFLLVSICTFFVLPSCGEDEDSVARPAGETLTWGGKSLEFQRAFIDRFPFSGPDDGVARLVFLGGDARYAPTDEFINLPADVMYLNIKVDAMNYRDIPNGIYNYKNQLLLDDFAFTGGYVAENFTANSTADYRNRVVGGTISISTVDKKKEFIFDLEVTPITIDENGEQQILDTSPRTKLKGKTTLPLVPAGG